MCAVLALAGSAYAGPLGVSVSAELPHPLGVSLEARPIPEFSGSLSFGGLPTISVTPSGASGPVSGSILSPNVHLRWHPFGGAFFLGTAMGYQNISGSTTQDIAITSPITANVPTTVELSLKNLFLTPHLGWLWGMNSSGMFGGLEFGVQRPFSPSSELSISVTDPTYAAYVSDIQATSQYQRAVSDVEGAIDRLGRISLPYFAMRIGWMF